MSLFKSRGCGGGGGGERGYKNRDADPHHFIPDQDPAFYFNADPDPAFYFKVMGIATAGI